MNVSITELPPRQKEVIHLISKLTEEHGYPPTLAELAKAMGLRNRMTVHQHVVALKKKGLVRWEPGLNRSLRLIDNGVGWASESSSGLNNMLLFERSKGKEAGKQKEPTAKEAKKRGKEISSPGSGGLTGLPLVGTIAAGQPIDSKEHDEFLDIESRYGESGCFALRIRGDSMIEDGIYDGDYVIVKPNPSPTNGDIVVATLEDGSATLKRFYKEKNRFRLQPANSEMEPIFIQSAHDLNIQGTVVALFRRMS